MTKHNSNANNIAPMILYITFTLKSSSKGQ